MWFWSAKTTKWSHYCTSLCQLSWVKFQCKANVAQNKCCIRNTRYLVNTTVFNQVNTTCRVLCDPELSMLDFWQRSSGSMLNVLYSLKSYCMSSFNTFLYSNPGVWKGLVKKLGKLPIHEEKLNTLTNGYWPGEFVKKSKLLRLVIISFILMILMNDPVVLL